MIAFQFTSTYTCNVRSLRGTPSCKGGNRKPMMWFKIRAGDVEGVAAALTPLLGRGTTTRLGLAPGLAMQDMGFPHLSFPIIPGRRASWPGLRHSGILRPASEMVVTKAEGRRRNQSFFLFYFTFFGHGSWLPTALAWLPLTSHRGDTFQRRETRRDTFQRQVSSGLRQKSSPKRKRARCRHGSFMSNGCMSLEDALV